MWLFSRYLIMNCVTFKAVISNSSLHYCSFVARFGLGAGLSGAGKFPGIFHKFALDKTLRFLAYIFSC